MSDPASRVAIACQGGGSHTAFTAGVLQTLMENLPEEVEIVALSGTSGGAMCATLAWDGLLRGDRAHSVLKLREFWDSVAADDVWDQLLNQSLMNVMSLRNYMALPEVSPYMLPPWGEERFRDILLQHFPFEELRRLARRPGAPALYVGAVEILSGHFEAFRGEDLVVECLLASAAVPELFRAVHVPGRGQYWDGLFSQNPPIHDLTDHEINELWVIQINPSACARVPTEPHEIFDRRNELAGNISMEQELRQIEMINRMIARGAFADGRFRPIHVSRVVLDRDLDFRSKLDRRAGFLKELMEYGRTKARLFLDDRQRKKYVLKALGVLSNGAAAPPSAPH